MVAACFLPDNNWFLIIIIIIIIIYLFQYSVYNEVQISLTAE